MEDLFLESGLTWCEDTVKCAKSLRNTCQDLQEEVRLKTELANLYDRQIKQHIHVLTTHAAGDQEKLDKITSFVKSLES